MSGGMGLTRYLKNYKTESIVGPLFKMLEASFELIVPVLMARLIDVGVGGRDTGVILTTACPMFSIYPILAGRSGEEGMAAAALLGTTLASFFSISALLWLLG